MLRFDSFSATQDNVRNATADKDRHLVQLLTTMTERIVKLEQQVNEFGQWRNNADTTAIRLNELEAGLGKLTDLTAGGLLDPFDERVLEVLEVRSGTAFSHIEDDVDDKVNEKLSDFIDSCSFIEAVEEAVRDGLTAKIEEALEGVLHDAIIDAMGDAEDIVRKGLRSIL